MSTTVSTTDLPPILEKPSTKSIRTTPAVAAANQQGGGALTCVAGRLYNRPQTRVLDEERVGYRRTPTKGSLSSQYPLGWYHWQRSSRSHRKEASGIKILPWSRSSPLALNQPAACAVPACSLAQTTATCGSAMTSARRKSEIFMLERICCRCLPSLHPDGIAHQQCH